jgi:hypothetical protein
VKAGQKDPKFKPVVFLVGDSDIVTGTWSSFETWLVKKLRPLGHIVILRWEYNTSANCSKESCGHSRLEHAGVGIRIKYCRTCNRLAIFTSIAMSWLRRITSFYSETS